MELSLNGFTFHTRAKKQTESKSWSLNEKANTTLGLIAKIADMPIPKKKAEEKQSDYMIRCVPQLMQYHDKSQAIAICYDSYKNKTK